MGGIIGFLAGPFGTFAVIAAGVFILWGAYLANNVAQRSRGAQQQIAKTEKANAVVVSRAARVRTKSLDPGVRGKPDPNYID